MSASTRIRPLYRTLAIKHLDGPTCEDAFEGYRTVLGSRGFLASRMFATQCHEQIDDCQIEVVKSTSSPVLPVVRIDHAGEGAPIELLVRLKHGSLHCGDVTGEAAAEVHLNDTRIHPRSQAFVQVELRANDTGG